MSILDSMLHSVSSRLTQDVRARYDRPGRLVALLGAIALMAGAFGKWAYSHEALDDMAYVAGPSPLQWFCVALAGVAAIALTLPLLKGDRVSPVLAWNRLASSLGTGLLILLAVILAAIAIELGGAINIDVGGWVSLVGALALFGGSRVLQRSPEPTLVKIKSPAWVQILAIVVVMATALFAAAYALGLQDGGVFLSFLIVLAIVTFSAVLSGLGSWIKRAANANHKVLVFSAFLVAFFFPFTQNGSAANMSIATQVLVFAATAVGLNIVVGLAGLLDLGYIAFLGAGAFVAAILSKSAFSTVDFHPPFIVVVLISGLVSATLGLIIGSPTLRVSGDYLAIVTLAFGEIFRITMNNLDGIAGPNLTRGSNGIPAIPDLNLFGFDFGEKHVFLGIEFGKFSNYYFVGLLVMALIIVVFTNLNRSRIGRGWVAIREDEKAAEAMGVNVFGLKIFAFAGGAFLAGVAGAVKAHQDVSVTPDQYIFLESAFLLAAVVLGGMGTVLGVILGAIILKLMPEKLRFVAEYRLMIFGLLLVLMMRFRPEGLIANERRQLEFHDEDEALAVELDDIAEIEPIEGRS